MFMLLFTYKTLIIVFFIISFIYTKLTHKKQPFLNLPKFRKGYISAIIKFFSILSRIIIGIVWSKKVILI